MSKKNNFVFTALHVFAWIIFIGLCINAGALLVNFVYALFKPEIVGFLYQKLDLSDLYAQSQWAFFRMYSLLIIVAILKAYLFYILIVMLLKLDMSNPFNPFVVEKISSIAYYTFAIGLVSLIARQDAKNLLRYGYEMDRLNEFWVDSLAFILMAAVVYVIAQIFKRGVELQNENDLTV